LLRQGGMGSVYRAWDLTLNIPVALKEMLPEPGLQPQKLTAMRDQFQREAQVLAGLHHPNLPRVTDFFQWEGNAYLVMDFVEGESLDEMIARQGPLPDSSVVEWAMQLLDALTACHERRIVHRDVKPHNIIIRTDGRAVLVDFGLVKMWDPRNPQTQHIVRGMGTQDYASPEHFSLGGQHTEPRSDLYSLGATLYHALTGHAPSSAFDRWANAACFVPPSALGARVRPPVEAAIVRAMAMDPAQRFASSWEMRAALLAATGQVAPQPPPRVAAPVQAARAKREAARPAPKVRSARWGLEMAVGALLAAAGMLVIQVVLFARAMSLDLYVGRTIGALVVGAVGWFVGDLIFEALARPQLAAAPAEGGSRPTQRLVAFTRRVARGLTTWQQILLLMGLLVVAAALVWVLGPPLARIWLVSRYVSFYALIGPLAYAASGRKPWRTAVAHTLVTTVGGALLGVRLGLGQNVLALFLAAALGGLVMEGIAFVAERWLK
ncbi:MAG: serine/threonine protein kinase, partial [Anaerolineae bacterium]|nr:serine/threonine protein kinase [Anaerolineae bacterium]